MALARDAGRLVSYDANLRLNLWPGEAAALEGLRLGLSHANVVKLSEEELGFLTGDTAPSQAVVAKIWHDDLRALFVTKGRRGSFFATRDFEGNVESFEVKAVDTTGAGDGFMAGLLSALVPVRDREPIPGNGPVREMGFVGLPISPPPWAL